MNRSVFRFVSTVFGGFFTAVGLVGLVSSQSKANAQILAESNLHATGSETIVDIASDGSSFSILVSALQAADLVETLSGPGPFTVFAPTNDAFEALPPGALERLLEPENRETLQRILTYHVVSGSLFSSDLHSGQVGTVEGSEVNLQVNQNGGVQVNNAKVISADVEASNGVIHVIDQVILPPDL